MAVKRPILFRNLRQTMCGACLDRNALTLDGRPRFNRGMKLTGGCEVCRGSGRVTEAELVTATRPVDREGWVLRPVAA